MTHQSVEFQNKAKYSQFDLAQDKDAVEVLLPLSESKETGKLTHTL